MSEGLHQARFEHDACGLGFVARADGARSRELVERALAMLRGMEHRGARGADPDTGDGAGLMLQVPDRLLRRFCRAELELELPPPGALRRRDVLPADRSRRCACAARSCACASPSRRASSRSAGATCRATPAPSAASRARASRSCGSCWSRRAPAGDERAFRRKLTVIRRRVELAAAARRVPEATFHIASFSSSTLTYKGLLTARAARRPTTPTCASPRSRRAHGARALALLDQHARLAGISRTRSSYLAHNGEINTVRGNRQWMHAREPQLRSRPARRRPAEAVPADRRALERLGRARRRLRAARARRAARPPTRWRC